MRAFFKVSTSTLVGILCFALLTGWLTLNSALPAAAYTSDLTAAIAEYPSIDDTRLDSCLLCHTIEAPSGHNGPLNSYGQAYYDNSENFAAIESLDSDGDGVNNITEINALTFPGDASDYPVVAPQTPTLLSPSNGTATTNPSVTLTWQAAGSGSTPDGYNVQVDSGDVITTTGTTSATVLAVGVHTWRVRAYNAGGYSNWTTAWTVEITEPLSAPGVPQLLLPASGTQTTTQEITLSWQVGTGDAPDGYNVQVDSGEMITTSGTTSTTVLAVGVHSWRVRAYNDAGYSDWTTAWTVEVVEPLSVPGVPQLLSPASGTQTTTQEIILAWQVGTGDDPDGYNVQVDGGEVITTSSTMSTTVLAIGEHTWTVRAYNAAGYSDWAAVWTVEVTETLPAPGVPELLSPADGTVTTTQEVSLAWQAGTGGTPDGYNVQVDGGDIVTTTETFSDTVLVIGLHSWAVRAYNATGYSDWAMAWTVEVTEALAAPGVPQLLSPASGTQTTTQEIPLAWQVGAGDAPDGYNVQVDGGEVITTSGTTSETVLAVGVHTWRVRAYNAAGYSDWTAAWTVEVVEPLSAPGVPQLLSPASGTQTTTQEITLAWQVGAGDAPDGYNVQVDGGEVITTSGTISGTVLAVGVHTWRVRAYNAAGYSSWTTAWTVEVTEPLLAPAVPQLLSPPSGTQTTTQEITLAWLAGVGSTPDGYNVQVDGGDVITTTGTTSETVLAIGQHTWTVRAYNAAGYSEWATPWTVEVTRHIVFLPLVLVQRP